MKLVYSFITTVLFAGLLNAGEGLNNKFSNCENLLCRSSYNDAITCYERMFPAVQDAENSRRAHMNYAEALLAEGRFIEGFKELDTRLHFRAPLVKPWDGSNPYGMTILIRAEQGLGDTFFFLRYAVVLKSLGATTILLAQKPLKRLLSQCPYLDKVIVGDDPLPHFDADVYMMSLPRYLSWDAAKNQPVLKPTTIHTVPQVGPYIFAESSLVSRWKGSLPSTMFKIGICWRASKLPAGQVRYLQRDIPLSLLAEIGKIPGLALYNLLEGIHKPIRHRELLAMKQSGLSEVQLKEAVDNVVPDEFPGIYGFVDFDKEAPFIDTAAVIANMDLIISVDTSVPNLAGAMGKPVWILLPHESDWRWGNYPRIDSPWLSTGRLFWQKKQGDWKPVMQEVMMHLKQLLKK